MGKGLYQAINIKKNLNMMEGEEEEDDDEERGGEEYFLEVNKGVNNGIMDEED